jgi:hypothetical protein
MKYNKSSTKEFIERSIKKHNNKYDYSLVEYTNCNSKVKIICPVHGEFEQTPNNHLRSTGCAACGKKQSNISSRNSVDKFIKQARKFHGDRYDYSLVDYKNMHTKVKIICPVHGEFEQTPNNHIRGRRCKKCSLVSYREKRQFTTEEFVYNAKEIHGDKYDYSLVDYTGQLNKINIICPIHGEFSQLPNNHLKYECNLCGNQKISNHRMTTEDFIIKAKEVHGDRYDYSLVDYKNMHTKVKIICKEHGLFEMIPTNHIHFNSNNCPSCACGNSKQEKEVLDHIKLHYNGIILENDRTLIAPKELDIVLPELKIAIEYCGLYWHSNVYKDKNYHLNKLEKCNVIGYRLITIFEDEWVYKQDIVKNKLSNIIGIDKSDKIFARKTKVSHVDKPTRNNFLNKHHIQGEAAGSINIGLEYDDKLVSVMSFKKRSEGVYELIRFASSCNVIGGFSKLLSHFKRNHEWNEIISFADLRWSSSESNVYLTNGFELDSVLKPEYRYIVNGERKHKFGFRHKNLKNMLDNYDPILSEFENTDNHGINRIYDCGLLKYSHRRLT